MAPWGPKGPRGGYGEASGVRDLPLRPLARDLPLRPLAWDLPLRPMWILDDLLCPLSPFQIHLAA